MTERKPTCLPEQRPLAAFRSKESNRTAPKRSPSPALREERALRGGAEHDTRRRSPVWSRPAAAAPLAAW